MNTETNLQRNFQKAENLLEKHRQAEKILSAITKYQLQAANTQDRIEVSDFGLFSTREEFERKLDIYNRCIRRLTARYMRAMESVIINL